MYRPYLLYYSHLKLEKLLRFDDHFQGHKYGRVGLYSCIISFIRKSSSDTIMFICNKNLFWELVFCVINVIIYSIVEPFSLQNLFCNFPAASSQILLKVSQNVQ